MRQVVRCVSTSKCLCEYKQNKHEVDKNMAKNENVVIGILIVAVVAVLFGMYNAGMFAAGGTGDAGTIKVDVEGNDATSTSVYFGYAFDALAPTTKLTTADHEYLVSKNGNDLVDLGSVNDGTAKTLAPGNRLQVLMGHNSSDYYAKMSDVITIPDTGSMILSSGYLDMGLYKNYSSTTSATVTIVNQGGTTANGASAEQAINAGDVIDMELSVRGVYQQAFSPEGDALVVCDINKTTIDDLDLGAPFVKSSTVPSQHTVGTTDDRAISFTMPGFVGVESSKIKSVEFIIDADDSTAPGNNEDIECTIYDQDWFQDSVSGEWKLGYETDAAADVGGPNQAFTVYYS